MFVRPIFGGSSVPFYDPTGMTYDGSTGYFTFGFNSSSAVGGQDHRTVVMQFQRSAFTGGGAETLLVTKISTYTQLYVKMLASDYSVGTEQSKIFYQRGSGKNL